MAAHVNSRLLVKKIKDCFRFIQKRNRVKSKWANTRAKIPAPALALQHFDVVYSNQFGDVWPAVRIGLLSEQKYGALLNNFTSTADVLSTLCSDGCRDFIIKQKSQQMDEAASETNLQVESKMQCFVFPRGDISRFRSARPGPDGLLGYYLMDAASILPVLALDVQSGDSVLDLCAGPGGKTLAILQSQAVSFLWANDLSGSRTARLQRMLQSYIPKKLRTDSRIRITSFDGRRWCTVEDHTFDRVLVDVPCTTDRHSLTEEENNIFKRSRTKERQKLPILQLELLLAGIQATRPGGQLVYSTCSLSQLQNECVVKQAISLAQQDLGITVQPQDLSDFTRLFSGTFHFASKLPLGELVLPHLTANFGPIYMCKLQRLS